MTAECLQKNVCSYFVSQRVVVVFCLFVLFCFFIVVVVSSFNLKAMWFTFCSNMTFVAFFISCLGKVFIGCPSLFVCFLLLFFFCLFFPSSKHCVGVFQLCLLQRFTSTQHNPYYLLPNDL